MKSYNIALMPGDGTGPEVLVEGVKVLDAVAAKYGFKLNYENYDFGGERYMKTGECLPDNAVDELKKHDSIFLGAIGHPDVKPGILELGILLKLRFALDQYINLRPVKLYPNVETPLKDKGPEHIDFTVIRENTGGIYTGMGGAAMVGTPNEVATQVMVYTRPIVERCLRYAYEYTRKRNKNKTLTLVHKCNVLTHVGDLWVRAHKEIGDAEFQDIKQDYNHVDAATMWMVKSPEFYDVIVTSNMFGDILADEAAEAVGGLGIAASACIGGLTAYFEPVHGSAPDIAGQGKVNPTAMVLSAAMMLEHLGQPDRARALDEAVAAVYREGRYLTPDQNGTATTTEMARAIASKL